MKRCLRAVGLAAAAVGLAWGMWSLATADPAGKAGGKTAGDGAAVVATPDVPLVADAIRELMQDRKFAEAVKAIDAAAKQKDAPVDYLTWLKGRALSLDGKLDEAIGVFEAVEKQFPKSPWVRRARFSRALCFAKKGDFQAAELIYRAEAEYLLSTDRKQEIANLYLEFADTYFKPPKEEQKPDYAKALEFYQKALEVGPKPQKQIEVELLVAECQQSLGKLEEAAALFEKFDKEHGDSPLDVEARFRLGQCRLTQGRFKDARRVWQDLLAKYPDAKSERIPEAAFQLSRTWGIPPVGSVATSDAPNSTTNRAPNQPAQQANPPGNPAVPPPPPATAESLSLGVAALDAFIERFPAHKLASRAHLDIAASYMAFGRYDDAVTALKQFLADNRYADREEVPEGRQLLGLAYQLQKKFPEALAQWHDYLVKHPTHKAWSRVQQEIVNTEYLMALDKMEAKQYEAAVKLFNEFLAKYPLDARDPTILYFFGAMDQAQEKWDAAIADWQRLVSKYPGTDWAWRGQFMIAETLETHLGKLEEALEAYRKVTAGTLVAPAQVAVARLTAKRLGVATQRVFRSDETPKLNLVTRNLESVTVRAYKVDLETYFRKMHLASGVEGLDIALIGPDRTFDFAVPKYAKFQELESQVDVPLPPVEAGKPLHQGVMAVTVSSKTHEATTLVIQSDLDIIVKSSRSEVFVFAENMRTGRPWPEVKLLVSNGKQVFAEGVTGKDGVFHAEYKELKDAANVRVFATADGHVASNVVGLQGVGVAQGLADKGYLYTDRPAYRAGDLVHLRGILRRAAEDAYVIDKGKKYTLDVFDARNRLVHQTKVELGAFGAMAADFTLPAGSPQGQYRFAVRDEANKTFAGTFLVQEYVLEPIRLAVDTPRRVYYRGEEIEGTIRASYYYGAPLASHEVRYQLADDRLYTATTDAKGEVHFKLPTREFSETQVLPLVVTLPERNLQTAANFVLSCQGFSIAVSTVRPVYVAGETFEATVKATDAEGKPIAQKLTLSILERTVVEGKVGERSVEKHAIETAADGSARVTLKLEKGGRYTLRAEGTDRFKSVVSGQGLVQVSDEEDLVRLRILADRHTFKVGDTAKVQLLWREEPALALVTFQGAKVLEYRLVQLTKGNNSFDIPMTAKLAPNFELAVAVMTNAGPLSLRERAGVRAEAESREATGPHPNPLPKGEGTSASRVQPPVPPTPNPQSPIPNPPLPPRRFHAASSPFAVERDLKVAVSTKRKGDAKARPRPGEEIEVAVTTTDPQGKPVAAEVSLAMVERALLERFASPMPAIQDYFRGGLRQPAVRTTASVTFGYHPATRPIDAQLLAEQDRQELAKEEALSRQAAAGETRVHFKVEELALREEELSRDEVSTRVAAGVMFMDDARWRLLSERRTAIADHGTVFMGGQALAALGDSWSDTDGTDLDFGVELGMPDSVLYLHDGTGQTETMDGAKLAFQRQFINGTAGTVIEYNGQSLNAPQLGGIGGYAPVGRIAVQPGAGTALNRIAGDGSRASGGGGGDRGGARGPASAARSDQPGQPVIVAKPVFETELTAKNTRETFTADLDIPFDQSAFTTPAGQPPLVLRDTGYWNPAVVTGADGRAVLKVTVPERSTSWNLVAKGITQETLAGESTGELVVKKDLFGELKLPMAFTDGDEAEVTVSVHNDAIDKGQIEVVLKTTIGGRSVEEKKTIERQSKGDPGRDVQGGDETAGGERGG